MPEMHFEIAWPDGVRQSFYSPSLVIKDYLTPGRSYDLPDFLARGRDALRIASDRVREKYGVPCSRAMVQLAALEAAGERYKTLPEASIVVLAFHE